MVLEQLTIQCRGKWTPTSTSSQTIMLLEENIQYICNLQVSKDFLNETQKAMILKEKILSSIKIQIFYSSENAVKKKIHHRLEENIYNT